MEEAEAAAVATWPDGKGIVNRDLKPENIFLTKAGPVKILDFGLAKRVETVAPGQQTSAPTGSGHSEPGTVMGTAGFMAPEQLEGKEADARTDIFACGAVPYEGATGKKAVAGTTPNSQREGTTS